MRKTAEFFTLVVLTALFLVPFPASAQSFGDAAGILRTNISFGGTIVTIVPCSGGMRHVTIAPAGAFPIAYIWTPATVTYSAGRPRFPGQQILGVADFPWVCFIGGGGFFSSPIPLYGLRMKMVGTSSVL